MIGVLLILTITAEWRLNYQWWELRTNTQLDQVAIDPCTDRPYDGGFINLNDHGGVAFKLPMVGVTYQHSTRPSRH